MFWQPELEANCSKSIPPGCRCSAACNYGCRTGPLELPAGGPCEVRGTTRLPTSVRNWLQTSIAEAVWSDRLTVPARRRGNAGQRTVFAFSQRVDMIGHEPGARALAINDNSKRRPCGLRRGSGRVG